MKRFALLAGLLMCVGCITSAPPEILPPAPMEPVKSYPEVTPEKANEQNRHQVAQELEDEINRAQQRLMLTTVPR